MTQNPDFDDLLPATVAAILDAVAESDRSLQNGETDNFAFNVLLNALCTVLEAIRINAPDQYDTYLAMAVMTLRGDMEEEATR